MMKILILVFGLLLSLQVSAQNITWTPYKNQRFGFEVDVPSTFTEQPSAANEAGKTFVSEDGKASISASAQLDESQQGAQIYFDSKLKGSAAYGGLIGTSINDYSIVLTGVRGDQIFFEEFLFSCKDKVINFLSISYAKDQAAIYQPLIEKVQRKFSAGMGSETPLCTY